MFAFLDCGIEEHGFARVRCDACRREFRVALSCKRRGFCPSCHAKRAVLWAEWLTAEVLAPVEHHQWVFTVPKRLRLFFLYDRRLLGALSRCEESQDKLHVGHFFVEICFGIIVPIRHPCLSKRSTFCEFYAKLIQWSIVK